MDGFRKGSTKKHRRGPARPPVSTPPVHLYLHLLDNKYVGRD